MKSILLLTSLFIIAQSSFAQFKFGVDDIVNMMGGSIISDRPSQCMNADPAGMGIIQVQTGLNYTRQEFTGGNIRSFGVPTTVKLGILPSFELNTNFTYLDYKYSVGGFGFNNKGFQSPDLGMRYRIIKKDGFRPAVAIQANMSIPSSSGDYQQSQLGSSVYLITKNQFGKVSLSTNLGMIYGGHGSNNPSFTYVLNLGLPLGDKGGFFIEGFGSLDNTTLFGDMGFSYLATKNIQLDIFGGWLGQTNPDPFWFVEAGISWRYSVLKKIAKKKLENLNPFGS